jgi:5-methylthioadenosine/S-adenosylhomocysteine deaminase
MSQFLLHHAGIMTMDASRSQYMNGAILIDGDRIIEIGESDVLLAKASEGIQQVNLQGKWILPGFINTHVHLSQQLGRGLADDVDLLTWLRDRIWPYESSLTEEDNYISSLMCGMELIRSGVTCFAEAGGQHVDSMAQAVDQLGIRAMLTRSTMDMGEGLPESWQMSTDQALEEQVSLHERWHGKAGGRLAVWFGLRTIFNNSDALIQRSKELADQYGVGIHMHVAEVPDEIEFALQTRGASTVRHLEDLGVLDKNFLAVHCVWLDGDEISIFARHDVKVSHNPAAALKVLGFPKIPEMINAGVCVALGTDGAPANNHMTLIDDMWLAYLFHKARLLDPTVMPAEQVLAMATCDGARALLMEDQVGSLQPGRKADLVVINPNTVTMLPMHDPVANMVSALRAENVESVMVDGQWVMWQRNILTVNEDEIIEEAKVRARAVAQRAGIHLTNRFNVRDQT